MSELATAVRTIVVEREMWYPPETIFQPIVGHRFNFRAAPLHGWNGVTDCAAPEVEPPQRLERVRRSGGRRPQDNRDLDTDALRERNAYPDGTVRLSAAGRGRLSRHGRRLAAHSGQAGGSRLPIVAIWLEELPLRFGVGFWLSGARARSAVS